MRKISLFLILLSLGIVGYSQIISSVKSPLEDFFKRNYDSTIILHSWGDGSYNEPDYVIISKRFDTIYYYHYYKPFNIDNLGDKVGPYNSNLSNYFINRFEKNSNSYLSPYNEYDIKDDSFFWVFTEISKGSLWEKVQTENIWNFIDKHNENFKKNEIQVNDGFEYEYRLVTHDKIIELNYNSPELYPKNKLYHFSNRIREVNKLIYNFYSNHKINFKL
jgi:hypothetical protein